MLKELYHYTRVKAPKSVRKQGYVYESVAQWTRYQRHSRDWAPHLENSKHAIVTSAAKCLNRKAAVVLGAGWLLDVPVSFLSHSFQKVVLVDIVLTPAMFRAAKTYSNIEIQQVDLTQVSPFLADPQVDYVVSANLLSQLHLQRQSTFISCAANHIAYLKKLRCVVCLIADCTAFVYEPNTNQLLERKDLLEGLPLSDPDALWQWHIAPPGERDAYDHYNEVGWFLIA